MVKEVHGSWYRPWRGTLQHFFPEDENGKINFPYKSSCGKKFHNKMFFDPHFGRCKRCLDKLELRR